MCTHKRADGHDFVPDSSLISGTYCKTKEKMGNETQKELNFCMGLELKQHLKNVYVELKSK